MRFPALSVLCSSLGLAVLALGGCAAAKPGCEVRIAGAPTAAGAKETYALDVENGSGGVRVWVDAKATAPSVRVMVPGDPRAKTPAWAAAQIEKSDLHPILRVIASPPGGSGAASADLEIVLPGCAGVRIRNHAGPVDASGVRGAVDVQSGSSVSPGGAVSVRFAEAIDAPVLVKSWTAGVTVTAPRASKGSLTIHSREAPVLDLPRSAVQQMKSSTGDTWKGDLNGGGFDVVLWSETGTATLRLR